MSIKTVPGYVVICDDCEAESTDDDEFSAYGDVSSARDAAQGFAWRYENDLDLCLDCWTRRTCDDCGELDCREHGRVDDDPDGATP